MLKNKIISALGILILAGCHSGIEIDVRNPLDQDRHPELAELCLDQVKADLRLQEGEGFIVMNDENEEVPYQVTYDGKVVFPVELDGNGHEKFYIRKGTPSEYTVKVCGKHYPERIDDICWENDLVGFRVYGYKEDSPSGYDFFTKRNTDLPVIDEFYRINLDPEMKKIRKEIAKFDKDSSDRFLYDHMSFHVDHGFGADCYGVGKTLGGGVAALLEGERIVYPFCYENYEILDNGPLRFTLKLTFRPFNACDYENIVETRIMTLDLGSHFTRTEVSFAGIDKPTPIVSGIVVQDRKGEAVGDAEKGYIAYPAPTINFDRQRDVDNGTIYVGNVFPFKLEDAGLTYFSEKDSMAGPQGHILAHSTYDPAVPFVYYWGFGWDHADIADYDEWLEHLETFASQLRNPIEITVK